MKLQIITTSIFDKSAAYYIKKRQLLEKDLLQLKMVLAMLPDKGDLIAGTGGIRKIRLKASGSGKSGGFRVCYYYRVGFEIYLLLIYPKNKQENLTSDQKSELKHIVQHIKELS